MQKLFALALVISISFFTAVVSADELIDGCDNCHGKDGNSEDGKVPSIAGFSAQYIMDSFENYNNKERPGIKYKPENGDETDMATISNKLSVDAIEKVAAYYAGKSFKVHEQAVDAGKAAKGKKAFDKYCDKCHSEAGTAAEDDAGLLLGQWKPYLEEQFKLYNSGERTMPRKMKKKFKKLSDEDIANVIEFLAEGKG
ncbi:MAG: c-type cytochrome [Chromatiales bacterium]|jgi:sulfide dehydrogenase cytochrome subunit